MATATTTTTVTPLITDNSRWLRPRGIPSFTSSKGLLQQRPAVSSSTLRHTYTAEGITSNALPTLVHWRSPWSTRCPRRPMLLTYSSSAITRSSEIHEISLAYCSHIGFRGIGETFKPFRKGFRETKKNGQLVGTVCTHDTTAYSRTTSRRHQTFILWLKL